MVSRLAPLNKLIQLPRQRIIHWIVDLSVRADWLPGHMVS